jgi:hypothetical protein
LPASKSEANGTFPALVHRSESCSVHRETDGIGDRFQRHSPSRWNSETSIWRLMHQTRIQTRWNRWRIPKRCHRNTPHAPRWCSPPERQLHGLPPALADSGRVRGRGRSRGSSGGSSWRASRGRRCRGPSRLPPRHPTDSQLPEGQRSPVPTFCAAGVVTDKGTVIMKSQNGWKKWIFGISLSERLP